MDKSFSQSFLNASRFLFITVLLAVIYSGESYHQSNLTLYQPDCDCDVFDRLRHCHSHSCYFVCPDHVVQSKIGSPRFVPNSPYQIQEYIVIPLSVVFCLFDWFVYLNKTFKRRISKPFWTSVPNHFLLDIDQKGG